MSTVKTSCTARHILSLAVFLVTATQIVHRVQKCTVPSQLTTSMRAELCSLYVPGGEKSKPPML